MNLIFDALNAQLDAGDRRMDAAGMPKIVPIACPFCGGSGWKPVTSYSSLAPLEQCTQCRHGKITVEA